MLAVLQRQGGLANYGLAAEGGRIFVGSIVTTGWVSNCELAAVDWQPVVGSVVAAWC